MAEQEQGRPRRWWRRRHRHDWTPVAVEHHSARSPFAGSPFAGYQAPTDWFTDVQAVCGCGETKTDTLEGRWTLDQLRAGRRGRG